MASWQADPDTRRNASGSALAFPAAHVPASFIACTG
jgi:hypothetical protein